MEKCDLCTLRYMRSSLLLLVVLVQIWTIKCIYSITVHVCEIPLMERWDSSFSAASRQAARNHRPLVNSVGFPFSSGGLVESDWFAQLYRFVILI